jgi:transposase
MKSKPSKRKRVQELTPAVLNQLDQDTLIALVLKLYDQNKQLSEQLRAFIEEKYGSKTERHEHADQLRLFEQQQAAATDAAAENKPPAKPKKPGHGRNPMPSHVQTKELKRKPTAAERKCSCGSERSLVNEVVRNRRFECIPATIFVEEIVDCVWQCKGCGDSIVVEPDFVEPIPNGSVGPDLLIKIAEERWLNHNPYYRQEQGFARLGIKISRSTMCGWMVSLSDIYSRVYQGCKGDLLLSEIIETDDTPVKVQDRTKKSNIRRGYEWIFRGDRRHPVNVFHYTRGRSRAGPKEFIPGFKKFLLGDCFSGNRALCAETGATHVACRAHDRRYYKKARANNKKLCDEMLDMYEELFEVDRTARQLGLSAEDTLKMRQQEAVPILTRMKKWLDEQALSALPSSSFGKAVAYSLNNWSQLNNYLLHGELRIDNNLAEQEMKRFATGRKNWYFFGSDESGAVASTMLTIFSTCLRNGVEPGAYFRDTLPRLLADPGCDIEPLLPHKWKPPVVQAQTETEAVLTGSA